MSLIFKALQRFQQPELHPESASAVSTPKPNGYTFRKIFFSAPMALGVATAIVIVGIMAYQTVNYFSRKGQALPSIAEASLRQPSVAADTDPAQNPAVPQVPEPTPASPELSDPGQAVTYQIHPPEPNPTGIAHPLSEGGEEVRSGSADAVSGEPGGSAGQLQASSSGVFSYTAPSGRATTENSAANQWAATPGQAPRPILGQQAAVAPTAIRDVLVPSPSAARPLGSRIAKKLEAANSADHLEPMQDQRRQVAQARRHLKVARLVNHIHGAIQADDVQLTAQLIKELMQLKGPENPFVAKLKAYSLIRQDRLEEAKSILGKVLAHSANDFEAGLNMAVIDIKSGRFDQARQRLMGLQERFPEKESVAFCLKQLPR